MTEREQRIWDAVFAGHVVKHNMALAATPIAEAMRAADYAVDGYRAEMAERERLLEEQTRPAGDTRKKR